MKKKSTTNPLDEIIHFEVQFWGLPFPPKSYVLGRNGLLNRNGELIKPSNSGWNNLISIIKEHPIETGLMNFDRMDGNTYKIRIKTKSISIDADPASGEGVGHIIDWVSNKE